MRVTGVGPAPLKTEPNDTVDLNRCTRCGESWGFEIVERVEIWKCVRCGYEARERSSDLPRMMDAEQESMAG